MPIRPFVSNTAIPTLLLDGNSVYTLNLPVNARARMKTVESPCTWTWHDTAPFQCDKYMRGEQRKKPFTHEHSVARLTQKYTKI